MKIQLELSAKERLEAFLQFVGDRAHDKAHENNGDVIADFIDKFVVVELKRLENNPETFSQDIEIPDSVLVEPLTKMKAAVDGAFDSFMNGKGITVPKNSPASTSSQSGTTAFVAQTAPVVSPGTVVSGPRNGNGHKAEMKRKLNSDEKDIIRTEFTRLNGEFEDEKKSCTAMLTQMGTEITVFQVTGFVSYLHREIASGRWSVPDMDSYMAFLENHKKMWAQYNSPKYQNLRAQNTSAVAQTIQTPTPSVEPKFRAGRFPQKTA